MTYEQLMAKLPAMIVGGNLTPADIQAACEMCGLPSIASLQQRPDLVAMVAGALKLA